MTQSPDHTCVHAIWCLQTVNPAPAFFPRQLSYVRVHDSSTLDRDGTTHIVNHVGHKYVLEVESISVHNSSRLVEPAANRLDGVAILSVWRCAAAFCRH